MSRPPRSRPPRARAHALAHQRPVRTGRREQIRLSNTSVGGSWELYKLAASVQTGDVAADAGTVSQLIQILGAEDSLLDECVLKALMRPKNDLNVLLECGCASQSMHATWTVLHHDEPNHLGIVVQCRVLDRMFQLFLHNSTPSRLSKDALKFARRLCRDSCNWRKPQTRKRHVHKWDRKQCMCCSQCGLCTGYGGLCVNTPPGKRPRPAGKQCGCGVGDSGCAICGVCRACADKQPKAPASPATRAASSNPDAVAHCPTAKGLPFC